MGQISHIRQIFYSIQIGNIKNHIYVPKKFDSFDSFDSFDLYVYFPFFSLHNVKVLEIENPQRNWPLPQELVV